MPEDHLKIPISRKRMPTRPNINRHGLSMSIRLRHNNQTIDNITQHKTIMTITTSDHGRAACAEKRHSKLNVNHQLSAAMPVMMPVQRRPQKRPSIESTPFELMIVSRHLYRIISTCRIIIRRLVAKVDITSNRFELRFRVPYRSEPAKRYRLV